MRHLVVLLVVGVTPLAAQHKFPPDSLVNLKVLPKNTAPREAIAMMRGFTNALGVRCPFCHVGEEGKPLDTFDFPSDEKRAKQVAREMMRMVQTINEQTITRLPERTDTGLRVTCVTCHRGVGRPVPLDRIVVEATKAAGTDSAIQAYRALRTTYYGTDGYNFGERTLVNAALTLSQERQFDAALALLGLDNEFYPQGSILKLATGDVQRARGDTTAAIKAYRDALARDPQNGQARQRLTDLGQQP